MSVIGTWKTKKVIDHSRGEKRYLTKEEYIEEGILDFETEGIFMMLIEIKEEGVISQYILIPEERMAEAVESGAEIDEMGRVYVEDFVWRERDGQLFCIFEGREIPLEITEDGLLVFAEGVALLERV